MAWKTISVEGVLEDFPTPIIPMIRKEPTRETLIYLHQLISGNEACVASNLGVIRHGYLTLTITAKEYISQTGYAFVPLHNPGN